MFEKYPMTHCRFIKSDRESILNMQSGDKGRDQNYLPMLQADFSLDGYVDVLDYFPCVEDAWYEEIRLQSFSHMLARKDYFTERSSLDSFLILLTLDGRGTLIFDEKRYTLTAGDIFWIDCQRKHYYRTDGDAWDHCDLHINGRQVRLLYETFRQGPSPLVHQSDPARFLALLTAVLDAYICPSRIRSLSVARSVQELCFFLIQESMGSQKAAEDPENQDQIRKALSYLHENFRSPIRLDDLASEASLSKFYFSRRFRRLTGFSPGEYLIRLRLEYAKTLLETTDLPIRTVGEMSGFTDEAYFSRLFHQRTGTNARAYRKEKRRRME